jgi:hypothetical protein
MPYARYDPLYFPLSSLFGAHTVFPTVVTLWLSFALSSLFGSSAAFSTLWLTHCIISYYYCCPLTVSPTVVTLWLPFPTVVTLLVAFSDCRHSLVAFFYCRHSLAHTPSFPPVCLSTALSPSPLCLSHCVSIVFSTASFPHCALPTVCLRHCAFPTVFTF